MVVAELGYSRFRILLDPSDFARLASTAVLPSQPTMHPMYFVQVASDKSFSLSYLVRLGMPWTMTGSLCCPKSTEDTRSSKFRNLSLASRLYASEPHCKNLLADANETRMVLSHIIRKFLTTIDGLCEYPHALTFPSGLLNICQYSTDAQQRWAGE